MRRGWDLGTPPLCDNLAEVQVGIWKLPKATRPKYSVSLILINFLKDLYFVCLFLNFAFQWSHFLFVFLQKSCSVVGHLKKNGSPSPTRFEKHFYSNRLTNYSHWVDCLVLQIMFCWDTDISIHLHIVSGYNGNWVVNDRHSHGSKAWNVTLPFIRKVHDLILTVSLPLAQPSWAAICLLTYLLLPSFPPRSHFLTPCSTC